MRSSILGTTRKDDDDGVRACMKVVDEIERHYPPR